MNSNEPAAPALDGAGAYERRSNQMCAVAVVGSNRRVGGLVGLSLFLSLPLLAVACGDEHEPVDSLGRPVVEIPSEWDSESDEIIGRFRLYREALAVAAGPPKADPDFPPLQELAADYPLIRSRIEQLQRDDLVIVIPEGSINEHMITLPEQSDLSRVEGNTVTLFDCWVQDVVLQTLDGDEIDAVFNSSLGVATMIVQDGEWKLFDIEPASPFEDAYWDCEAIADDHDR